MASSKARRPAPETDPLLDGTKRRMLLAASTGGHLAQLVRISEGWNLHPDSQWITFDSPQSRSLLQGRQVLHVPYVPSRSLSGVIRTLPVTRELLKQNTFDAAASTGAALALGVLPIAKLRGIPTFYIESVSRVHGPSLTGRILDAARLASSFRTQHPSWSNSKWRPYPSVMSQFTAVPRSQAISERRDLNILVTLGTIRPYRFDSLVDALLRTGLVGQHTHWQLGVTTRSDLPGLVSEQMGQPELIALAKSADVVVTHAGVGTILSLLENGVHPVVVPRRRFRGEHVDDHQEQIAKLVAELGVATVVDSDQLTAGDLLVASSQATVEVKPTPAAGYSVPEQVQVAE